MDPRQLVTTDIGTDFMAYVDEDDTKGEVHILVRLSIPYEVFKSVVDQVEEQKTEGRL
jgi:hypothetical protein